MVFTPSLEFGAGDSFFEMVESLINDVFRMSTLVPRLAHHSPFPHYQVRAGLMQREHQNMEVTTL